MSSNLLRHVRHVYGVMYVSGRLPSARGGGIERELKRKGWESGKCPGDADPDLGK
jgi:hypothetical protein